MNILSPGKLFQRKSDCVILFSGVFLRRNLTGVPFPSHASRIWLDDIEERVRFLYRTQLKRRAYRCQALDINALSHLASHFPGGLFASYFGSFQTGKILIHKNNAGFFVNDQDHFRIFSVAPGMRLEYCHQRSQRIDDFLESHFDYAFHKTWGYLTADLRECGTGMRAEIRIHLPALAFLYGENALMQLFRDKGFFIEQNTMGNHEARGHIFQITNHFTLGITERTIIDSLKSLASGLVRWERQVRRSLARSLDRRRQLEENVLNGYKRICEMDDFTQRELFNLFSLWVLARQQGIFVRSRGLNITEVKNLVKHIVTRNRTLGKECVKLLNFFGVISGEELCNV
ncbi:MAG TPA: hypothetical protein VLH40_08230 [Atribacteraceae bacterium]|nr:hypothetical protein [Atribacteraceae bacterium]